METLEILTKARKLIETPERWYGHGSGANSHCAQTAISAIAGAGDDVALLAFHKAAGAADYLTSSLASSIWAWNDAHERSHAEVLAAFDKAIEAERASAGASITNR